jgi:hypothetical protein
MLNKQLRNAREFFKGYDKLGSIHYQLSLSVRSAANGRLFVHLARKISKYRHITLFCDL